MRRCVAILGSTGSIGTQTLDVISQHRDMFEVDLLTANSSADLLIKQAIEFDVNNVVICDESKYEYVKNALKGYDTKVFAGMQSVCDLVTSHRLEIIVTAMVGFSGLKPTIAALKAGNDIRGGLIGPGVHASHGMERTHYKALENTIKLLLAYLL